MNEEKKEKTKPKFKQTNEDLKFSLLEVIILVVITAIVAIFVTTTINKAEGFSTPSFENEHIQKFVDEYKFILNKYYGEITEDELISNAIEGMVNGLDDPYSVYIDDDNAANFDVDLDGEFYGIGIQITLNNNNEIIVADVLEGYKAYDSGIKKDDIIVGMNGESIAGLSTSEFRAKMLNSNKDIVNLTVRRGEEVLNFSIERTLVEIDSVTSKIFEVNNNKVGYIGITIFAANTYKQFKKAIDDLEKKGIDSLIVDVRSNTGGHLSTVTDVISEFMDNTHVIYQIKDSEQVTKEYSTGTSTKNYKIVVLIDGASASASELLASALKEQLGATLIGNKSYGKSTVQQVVDLNNGTKYKITIKEWLTSEGNTINQKGIEPDIKVDLNLDYLNNPSDETDNQLQEAIKFLTK